MLSDINISQGSVATLLKCGDVCNYHFIANFLPNVALKEFWKSVNIWRSYGQEFGVLLFDSRYGTTATATARPTINNINSNNNVM